MKLSALIILILCLAILTLRNNPFILNASETTPKNVILIIGDGMDDQQITIARNYLKGSNGKFVIDGLPFLASVQTLAISETTQQLNYVADSASTGTTLATGVLTSNSRIATTAGDDRDITTITETANLAGYRTGIVTTASITDATPASFIAHISFRFCDTPKGMYAKNYPMRGMNTDCRADLKSNGGAGSIAEQITDGKTNLVFGGGGSYFSQQVEAGGISLLKNAQNNDYVIFNSINELLTVTTEHKVLGLFTARTMPVKLRGKDNARAVLIENNQLPPPFRCEPNPDFKNTPTLAAMTEQALNILSDNNDKGFFLMVESASIDKQSHFRNPCGSIGEVQQLDDAVAIALRFARTHPDTLLLITADHGHAAHIIPETSTASAAGFHSPGYFARLETLNGALLGVNYATTNSLIAEHSGVQVPLMAYGLDTKNTPTHMTQIDIYNLMMKHLNLK